MNRSLAFAVREHIVNAYGVRQKYSCMTLLIQTDYEIQQNIHTMIITALGEIYELDNIHKYIVINISFEE